MKVGQSFTVRDIEKTLLVYRRGGAIAGEGYLVNGYWCASLWIGGAAYITFLGTMDEVADHIRVVEGVDGVFVVEGKEDAEEEEIDRIRHR